MLKKSNVFSGFRAIKSTVIGVVATVVLLILERDLLCSYAIWNTIIIDLLLFPSKK